MNVIINLNECYPILDKYAQERWDDLKTHGKLEDFFIHCEEIFTEPTQLSDICDYLRYEYESIAQALDFTPYSEEENLEESLKKLNQCIYEALEDEPHLATYNFTFKIVEPDLVKITDEAGNSYEVDADTSDKQYLLDSLESNLDLEVAPSIMDDDLITGTEIVGFKYDEESQTGSFEFNIFYTGELEESLNEAKKFYLGWRGNPQLKKGGYYKKFGQLTKDEANKKDRTAYGSMILQAYDTEEEYNKAIEDAKEKGFSVN